MDHVLVKLRSQLDENLQVLHQLYTRLLRTDFSQHCDSQYICKRLVLGHNFLIISETLNSQKELVMHTEGHCLRNTEPFLSPAFTMGCSCRAKAAAFTKADIKPSFILCFFRKLSRCRALISWMLLQISDI